MEFRLHHFGTRTYADQPTLLLLAGGPGMSSRMWQRLDSLAALGPVITVDFPGTAGLPEEGTYTFAGLVKELEAALSTEPSAPIVAVGFSFGGIFAAALAARQQLPVVGWIGLASPLSLRTMVAANAHFRPHLSPECILAEAAMITTPTNENFQGLLTALVPQYFLPENQAAGAALLAQEEPSGLLFAQVYGEFLGGKIGDAYEWLATFPGPKVLIAGARDGMMPTAALEQDARDARADWVPLPTSHFVPVEDPSGVTAVIAEMLQSLKQTDQNLRGFDGSNRQSSLIFDGGAVPAGETDVV